MYRSELSQVKSVLPHHTESQILFSLHQTHGNITETINHLLSLPPPPIERNVFQWFQFFDPLEIGLNQEDIIHALELTYGSDIKEFDFRTSVQTMWPNEVPSTIKMSQEVFSEPDEGLGIGIAEYARNLSPILAQVKELAAVLPNVPRQVIYNTLMAKNRNKQLALMELLKFPQYQSPSTIPPSYNSNPPPPPYQPNLPLYQSTIAPPQHFTTPSGSIPIPPTIPMQPAPNPPPYTPNPQLQSFKCGHCLKLISVPPSINTTSQRVRCGHCHAENVIPSGNLPQPAIIATIPQPSFPSSGQQTNVSPHSGYRPPKGISPAIPAPPMSPIHPARIGRKKALLIGINYTGQRGQLRGCCNDVKEIYNLLTRIYGWTVSDIRILTDEPNHLPNQLTSSRRSESIPNRRNILDGLNWLSQDVLPGDALFFHYSGHGAQQPDPNGIESDGMNETILPVDYSDAGMITDDEISSTIVQTLPDGVRLTCLMDSCHSGTGCDLPHTWNPRRSVFEREPNPYFSLGDVILFSGCQDDSTSCDVSSALSAPGGAMTTAFVNALKRNPYPMYDQLLDTLLHEMRSNGFSQKPQMSSNQEFEIGRQFSMTEALPNTNAVIGRTISQKFHSQQRREMDPMTALLLGGAIGVLGSALLFNSF